MSKKKQLAGKKTKLAKLPLTQALSRQLEEKTLTGPSSRAAEAVYRQLPLSWGQREEGRTNLLLAAYLQVVQDLLALQATLPPSPGELLAASEYLIPGDLPAGGQLQKVLRQAQSELKDLHRLLSG